MAQDITESIIVICEGCGEKLDTTPTAGSYRGGRHKKYHNDACRKRAERRKQREQALITGKPKATIAPRKRTQGTRTKALWKEATFYVFDWKSEHYGPMLKQDAERVTKLVGGLMFEADTFSAACDLHGKFLMSAAGDKWMAQQIELRKPKGGYNGSK